jgi:hypothetical protein
MPQRGIPIEMGGRDWVVPPLTLGQLVALYDKIQEIAQLTAPDLSPAQVANFVEIVHAALARNYPEVTRELLRDELLDLGNARAVMVAILTGSGLRPAAPGEATAVAAPQTGATSTGSSPPPAAGPTAISTS